MEGYDWFLTLNTQNLQISYNKFWSYVGIKKTFYHSIKLTFDAVVAEHFYMVSINDPMQVSCAEETLWLKSFLRNVKRLLK